ncbi:MAG: MBL fold metallo-hydrolase, partial [Verrucomicrobiota bacterium]
DHWDPVGAPEILTFHPACLLIAPSGVRPLAKAQGIGNDRIIALDVGSEMTAGPFRITALPTLHSDAAGIGLLVRAGGQSIYHSGDTEYTTALAKDLQKRLGAAPDLALLCINGHLGNMTWQEAALLAERLQPKLCIPNHYDLFLENQQDPAPFMERCNLLGLAVRTLVPGVPFTRSIA